VLIKHPLQDWNFKSQMRNFKHHWSSSTICMSSNIWHFFC